MVVVTAQSIFGTKPLTSGMQVDSCHSVPFGQSAGLIVYQQIHNKDICLGSPFVRENGRTEEKKLT